MQRGRTASVCAGALSARDLNCASSIAQPCVTPLWHRVRSNWRRKEGLKVRCPNCAVEVNPLREYCHSCGSPTDPDVRERLRARAGGRSPEELKSNRKTVLIACATIAALAVAGRLSWPGILPIHISSHSHHKGPVVTDAEQIYRAYHADPDAAAK